MSILNPDDMDELNKLDKNSKEKQDNDKKNDTKFNILDIFVNAIFKPSMYKEMLNISFSRTVGYIVFLSFLVAFMVDGISGLAMIAGFGGLKTLFLEKIPQFTVSGGELRADSKWEYVSDDMHFLIDTENETVDTSDWNSNQVYIVVSRKTYSFYLVEARGAVEMFNMKIGDIFMDGATNNDLVASIPALYITMIILLVISAGAVGLRYCVLALLYVLYMTPLNNVYQNKLGKKYSFSELYKVAFFAQTFGIMIVALYNATSLKIPAFAVSLAGVIFACYRMTSFFNPRPSNEEGD